ncbi:hypothetical protein K0M31_011379 [Melipona bicolor]|uniref:Uncharacterized protein n=1 Tax=Melipona bicolor TaxID=60889 RepID=A0AA40KUZ8_9HYME|nr:hypothetical protein K0M31_011379 [Melipona bicolor]
MVATVFVELCRKDLLAVEIITGCAWILLQDLTTLLMARPTGHAAAINGLIELADEHFVTFPSSVAIPL